MDTSSDISGETPCIALIRPKFTRNLAGILRACAAFEISQIWFTGHRLLNDSPGKKQRLPREMRLEQYEGTRIFHCDRFLDRMLSGTVPVCVELVPGAESLDTFEHPAKAVYIFGPEDGDVPKSIRKCCHCFVQIPVKTCLNLSGSVHIMLWDRHLKRSRG